MLTTFKSGLTWFAAATLFAGVAAGETMTVEFDPAQTQVEFKVSSTLHTVHGTFKLKKGSIQFDSGTGAASGTVVIDATSGESGNSSRDDKMQKSVLESQKFPEITFTPQHVKGQLATEGVSQIEFEGTFTLHGAGHPITMVATVTAHESGITATTHFVVPYIQWGLKNPSTFILRVADKVDIDIHANGRLIARKS